MKAIIGGILTALMLCWAAYIVAASGRGPAHPPPDRQDRLTIRIQPFTGMPASEVTYVYTQLKKVYTNTIVQKPIKLPAQAWYGPRSRYRADTIIAWLARQTPDNCVTIGLTARDISTDKGKIKDWGVMGLGYQPGKACVVSTFRLTKKNLLDQLFKVSIHELGHTQGLPHCPNKGCYMQDAEGGNPTDDEHGFCPSCRKALEEKGWVF